MNVVKRDGSIEMADKRKIQYCVERACRDLDDVDVALIVDEAYAGLFNGVTTLEIEQATIFAARARIAFEPVYSYAAARLLLNKLYRESFGRCIDGRSFHNDYRKTFVSNIGLMIAAGRLNPALGKFDLPRLAEAIVPERDSLFKYLGVQTLYDRYLIHINNRRMETTQAFWMRVAMGLVLNEADPTEAAIDAYELFSTMRYCPSTPTLFNAGTLHSQLSSCYLSTMEDSIDGIYGTLHNQARLSKYAGGLGIDITPLRGTGSYIKGTNGDSQGLIPWAKQFNDMTWACNQGGKRKGAAAIYCETWHIDIVDFLDLQKNTGDERRRCHDIHTANWIPDLFMKQVQKDDYWYLFSPYDCLDLHETYGEKFEKIYNGYVKDAKAGRIKNFRVMKAKDLWKKMLMSIKETGHPWICFKDPSNLRYSNQHIGVVHSSNLCTEILLHSKPTTYHEQEVVEVGETAVCNLGSVNLSAHVSDKGTVDRKLLKDTVRRAVRLLDNVVDLNYYPTREASKSNLAHRPIGLGIMGWADVLHKQKLAFDSDDAVDLADEFHEFISREAIHASALLAKERGAYQSYRGSTWQQKRLPMDTYLELMESRGKDRGEACELEHWQDVRADIAKYGMRNSNVMAIAPTATISYIVGCSQSIEPGFSVLYVYSTLSGDFTMVNEFFVKEMKRLKIWSPEFVKRLQQVDGDVKRLVLPKPIQDRFKTCFDVDQKKLIDAAAARQRWIDQGQSVNIYYCGGSMKELSDLYFHAWESGLKTTYYLHTRAASRLEKTAGVEKSSGTCVIGEVCDSCQ